MEDEDPTRAMLPATADAFQMRHRPLQANGDGPGSWKDRQWANLHHGWLTCAGKA